MGVTQHPETVHSGHNTGAEMTQNSKQYSHRTSIIAFHCVPPQHTQTNGFRHAHFENEWYPHHFNKTCNLHNISCCELHPNNLTNSMKDSPSRETHSCLYLCMYVCVCMYEFFRLNHLFQGMFHYICNIKCFVLSSPYCLNSFDIHSIFWSFLNICYWFCFVHLLVWFFWCLCAFINPQS
jgi:hypothetical protein